MHRLLQHGRFVPPVLLVLCLALPLFQGYASLYEKPAVYEKDGVRYGVTKGTFRSRWWNYYERGCSYLDGGYYAEAAEDFRAALQDRSKDQRWPRTYGLHFIPEYFPNRELGIALYHQQQVEAGIHQLELSLEQHYSARAAFYIAEARREWLAASGKDAAPPAIEVLSPEPGDTIGAGEVLLAGKARGDGFIAALTIDGQPFDVKICAAEVSFERSVPLRPMQNSIRVEATDLAGKTTGMDIPLVCDVDGPLVSFDAPLVAPGTLRGVAFDPSGVETLHISGKEAALSPAADGTVAFAVEVAKEDLASPLSFECADRFGNVTRGAPPLDMLVLNPRMPEILLCSGPGSFVPLGQGLYALVVNGENMAVAAAPEAETGVTIEMSNIAEGQQYYMDEIVVALNIRADSPIQDIQLNGEALPTLPGRNALRMSRRIRLERGANELLARAVDAGGAAGTDKKIVLREENAIEMNKSKLAVALLGAIGRAPLQEDGVDTEYVMNALAATDTVQERFTVVDRDLIREILAEQDLSEALASSKNKLALGKLIPAELMVAARIRRDQDSIEIVLEGSSTETAERILPRVDVAGPYADLDRLIEELGVRLAQDLPRVQGRVLQWQSPEITTDLTTGQGVRNSFKCLVFRTEPVLNPDSGETLGEKPVILCEGLFNNVTAGFSTAEALPVEEGQDLATLNLEAGQYVIIK